ncbi:MAG: hypothetical protein ACHQC8_02615 [Solirubrobacterales bacterium]
MKTLGLDLSLTNSGVVLLEDGIAKERYLIQTTAEVSDIDRFAYIAGSVMGQVIDGTMAESRVDLVAIEGVYASKNALTYGRLISLSAIVQFCLYRSKIPYVILPPSTWRRIVFGPKSKIDKERERVVISTRLKDHLGSIDVEKVDLNVLEAFCVALAAWKAALDPSLNPAKPPRRARTPKAVA